MNDRVTIPSGGASPVEIISGISSIALRDVTNGPRHWPFLTQIHSLLSYYTIITAIASRSNSSCAAERKEKKKAELDKEKEART